MLITGSYTIIRANRRPHNAAVAVQVTLQQHKTGVKQAYNN